MRGLLNVTVLLVSFAATCLVVVAASHTAPPWLGVMTHLPGILGLSPG